MSFALQANWHDQSLYLWARTGDGTLGDPAALRAVVGEVCTDALLASTVAQATICLRFPRDAEPRCTPALVLGPAEAVDFLTCLPSTLPPSCGPSVYYWSKLARLV